MDGKMTLFDRARAYVASMPPGISGQGGHQATFKVASALIHGFALSEEQAWPIFCEFNSRCSPPWNERELRHKLASAFNLTRHSKPRGHLSGISHLYAVGISRPEVRIYKLDPVIVSVRKNRYTPPLDSETTVATVAEPVSEVAGDSQAPADDPESVRIAGELKKLHRDGAIKTTSKDDAEAFFYASFIKTFGASYSGNLNKDEPTRLSSPTLDQLQPALAKPEAAPRSIVLIALEAFKSRSDCRVTVGFFTAAERRILKCALERCRQKRQAAQNTAAP